MHIERVILAVAVPSALALTGCPNGGDEEGGDDGAQSELSVEVAAVEGGVILSGYQNGDTMVMVGGTLSPAPGQEYGGPGTVFWIDQDEPNSVCRRENASDRTLWWVEGQGDGSWFAVGEQGAILRYDGDSLVDESVATDAILYGVRPGEQAVAVGGDPFDTQEGEIWQRSADGTWEALHTGLPGVAFKIWENWIVGVGVAWTLEDDGTLVEHFPPNNARLLTVRTRAADDVWAVGGSQSGIVLHFDGEQWEEIEFDTACGNGGLNGVWTGEGEDIWVAGFFGAMARYDGEKWICPQPASTLEHLHAVWPSDDGMWWGGGALLSAGGNAGLLGREGFNALELEVEDCEL